MKVKNEVFRKGISRVLKSKLEYFKKMRAAGRILEAYLAEEDFRALLARV